MYNNEGFFSHLHCIQLFSNISINITCVLVDPKNITLKSSLKIYITLKSSSNIIEKTTNIKNQQ